MGELIRNDVERFAMHEFVENAYLNYSMYVIMERALPYIGDGLKPVQRRIIYAMSELGINANAKFKKSARTIGDVLGKYHPHGDTACYEAMVLMAQPFSYRYPLVEGQGNWGAPDDPKSYAAMRYTESRLSKYSEILLNELKQATVDYIPNFDGTLQEPKTLPARPPNILLNGATGIAVGMATDIPPHNLYEVIKAIIKLIDNPKTTLGELLDIIHGLDFPTKAEIITKRDEIFKIYQNGRGSIRQRAIWKKEDGTAVITAIPYQVSNARILEQITLQICNKKLSMIKYLRDESDHENLTRLVVVPYNNCIDLEQVMNHLFITTDLEKNYRVNFNMIGLDNRLVVKNLLQIVSEWLIFRRDTIRRRLKHDLNLVLNPLYILEGLLIAFLNIKEVIDIISNKDEPNSALILRFNIYTIQAKAILELKLRELSKLAEKRIVNEKTFLEKEHTRIQAILFSERKINNLIKKELLYDSHTYGNVRCSPIYECEKSKLLNQNNLVINEPVTIILSQMGWVRSIKGHNKNPMNLKYKRGDSYLISVHGKSNQLVAFIDSAGRSYTLDYTVLSSEHIGEPLTSKLLLPPGAVVEQMLMEEKNQNLLVVSDAGYGFICTFSDLKSRKRSGKSFIKLPENSKMMMIIAVQSKDCMLLAITQASRMLIFPVADLPHISKGKGNKIISISAEKFAKGTDKLKWLLPLSLSSCVIFHIGKQKVFMQEKDLQKIYAARGQQGYMLCGLKHIDQVDLGSITR